MPCACDSQSILSFLLPQHWAGRCTGKDGAENIARVSEACKFHFTVTPCFPRALQERPDPELTSYIIWASHLTFLSFCMERSRAKWSLGSC